MGDVIRGGASITGAARSDKIGEAGAGSPDGGVSMGGASESRTGGIPGAGAKPEELDKDPVATAPMRGAVPAPAVGGDFSFFRCFSAAVSGIFFFFFSVAFGYLFFEKGVTRSSGTA